MSANWLHPRRLPVDVVVAPGNRHQGIGSALLEHLIGELPAADDRPLKAACWSEDQASAAFWSTHGFMPIMLTDIGTIDFTTQANVRSPATILPDHITIVSGDQLAPGDSLWDDIAQLHERVYRANHEWSPVTSIDLPLAREIFLDPDDLILDALLVAVRGGYPLAVASLRARTDDNRCELGWAGGDPGLGEEGIQAAHILMSRCLALARGRGWSVNVEADCSDPVLHSVVDAWPLMNHRVWVNYGRPG